MKTLSVQILPDRLPGIDIQVIVRNLEGLSAQTMVRKSTVETGVDASYINVNFVTSNVTALWKAIKSILGFSSSVPSLVSNGVIVVCEGDHGWDDYLLLYHFDQNEKIDNLPNE